jgi:hypothetical protein
VSESLRFNNFYKIAEFYDIAIINRLINSLFGRNNMKNFQLKKLVCLVALSISAIPLVAQASSHREAPFIASQPKLDGTDFYMFNSYETGRAGYVTLIANYQPFQTGFGGPNFYSLDPNGLYEIHINNDGTGKENITFQFRFQNQRKDLNLTVGNSTVAAPVLNVGDATNPANVGLVETYTVSMVKGDRRKGASQSLVNASTNSKVFTKPVDNIGKKSIADYNAYSNGFVYSVTIPDCSLPGKVFVGQRKDPFYISVGQAFDLLNYMNPLGPRNSGKNDLAYKNVSTIALEVPASCLATASDSVIGGWTSASMRQGRLLVPNPDSSKSDKDRVSKEGGAWVQVSRLGMPLVNEVVIGMKDKDRFNSSVPSGDGQFLTYVTNPTLPALVTTLFGVPAPATPRNDLVSGWR